MVATSGDGVADVGMDPLGLGGDELGKLGNLFGSCGWGMDEGIEAECPCHETKGDLLSVFPVGAGVGGIVVCPVLDELPEGLRVFFVCGGGVGADEGVDEGEAIWFPDILNIHMSLRGGLLFFPPKQSPVMRRLLRQKPRAPRSDIIIRDL